MNKCLVTKLNGVCPNDRLLKVGEFRLKVSKVPSPNNKTQGLMLEVSDTIKLKILGDGYFTDSSLSNNLGKEIYVTNAQNVFFSNGDYDISILDKYKICRIQTGANGVDYVENDQQNKSFDIDGLKFSKDMISIDTNSKGVSGNLSSLESLTKLNKIDIYGSSIYGDISALRNLTALTFLNIRNTNLSGDISALQNLTALTVLNITNTNLSGDISALQNLTALTSSLNLSALNIIGDVSALKGMSKIKEFYLQNMSIGGDLSQLPDNAIFVSLKNYKGTGFTWTSRPSSAKIIGIEGNPIILNLDKMLQDLANCAVGFDSTSGQWFKTISVIGSRTSASDSAVSTLQSKGYTINISTI